MFPTPLRRPSRSPVHSPFTLSRGGAGGSPRLHRRRNGVRVVRAFIVLFFTLLWIFTWWMTSKRTFATIGSNPAQTTREETASKTTRLAVRSTAPKVVDAIVSKPRRVSTQSLPQNDILKRILGPSIVSPESLTAVISLNVNVSRTTDFIFSLHSQASLFRYLIIAAAPSMSTSAKFQLQESITLARFPTVIRTWPEGLSTDVGLLHVAARAFTDWVLISDGESPSLFNADIFRNPPSSRVPVGPRGVIVSPTNTTCLLSKSTPQAAAFLYPPFLIQVSVLKLAEVGLPLGSNGSDVWSSLGSKISLGHGQGVGGIVAGTPETVSVDWCKRDCLEAGLVENIMQSTNGSSVDPAFYRSLLKAQAQTIWSNSPPLFSVLLPTMNDFYDFEPTLCRLAQSANSIRILIHSAELSLPEDKPQVSNTSQPCHIHFETFSLARTTSVDLLTNLTAWLSEAESDVDVFIHVGDVTFASIVDSAVQDIASQYVTPPTVVRFPRSELAHTEWAGTLTLAEWKHWHSPRVDISVIANDRPDSLERLLQSLNGSFYFGDHINLFINLEQTADTRTHRLVDSYEWSAGDVTVRHRIVMGGLMPAVVESWFPHANDSYGVILEDDVEVSPLFYAWVKMSILRYRYGTEENRLPRMFGVSLYQQKVLELKPEGRKSFDAQQVFTTQGFEHPNTPYLSQVPCSWGAVFFPEHWREFHDYLGLRLSQSTHDISEVIIPNIRSNKWARSWKKFFNELVFLRGYVMLYPNYDGFVSLSTNHLEVGSHIRALSEKELGKRREQFELPLLSPQDQGHDLLNLPYSTIPDIEELPVIDFWGGVTSQTELIQRGYERHLDVSHCPPLNLNHINYDAGSLLCRLGGDSGESLAHEEDLEGPAED